MQTCEKCNANFDENGKFCPECGSKVYEKVFCHNCGEKTSSEFDFCQKCGEPLKVEIVEEENNQTEGKSSGNKISFIKSFISRFSKIRFSKKSAIAALSVIALIALGTVFYLVNPFNWGKSAAAPSILYVKDNQLKFTFLKNIKPFEVNDSIFNLSDSSFSSSSFDVAYASSYCSIYTTYADNGKLVFYPDKIESSGSEATASFYYRNLKADNTKTDSAVKIDSDISLNSGGIKPSADGTKIFYVKGTDDKRLYYNNLKDKEKIDSDVASFFISSDGNYLVYQKTDGSIYQKDFKKAQDKEKIDDSGSIVKFVDDLSKIYYLKDNSLYLKERDKDKVKIASDVSSIVSITDSDYYYVKKEDTKVKLADYVLDDLAESDKAMTEPKSENYQKEEVWDNTFIYTTTDYTAYNAAYNKYNEKLNRDKLRAKLSTAEQTISNNKLFYNDGTKETLISENITNPYSSGKYVIYSKFNKSDLNKIKLSTINSTYDVQSYVSAGTIKSNDQYVAIKGAENTISQTKANSFGFNASGTSLYFIDDVSEKGNGTLMEAKFESGKIGTPAKIDDDVNSYRIMNDGTIVYFKDVKDGSGDMYKEGKKLAADVFTSSVSLMSDNGSLLYLADCSKDSNSGTLQMLENGKANKIADDVYSYVAENKKNIVVLNNYNKTKHKGDLMLFNNSDRLVKIDEDVTTVYRQAGAASYIGSLDGTGYGY